MKRIKETKIDALFSKAVRAVGLCERCGRQPPNVQLQCSHFFTRKARSTRWDFDNCSSLCSGCHRYFETRKNGEYRDWQLKKLGRKKFEALRRRYYTLKQWTDGEKAELLDTLSTHLLLHNR